jgi:mRNA interferase RelE/StbE
LAWRIDYTETAKKQLRKFDKQAARRLVNFMDDRIAGQGDPRGIGKALTGPMVGTYWRYRVGDYRIICDIQDGALCVLVIEVGNRRDVYR